MMSNREKYENVFIESFSVERDALNEQFVYQCIPAWDSVGHMAMISALEEAFGIMLEMDDIIDFSSFHKGIETLAKYGVDI
jgi:acyl carrier protein